MNTNEPTTPSAIRCGEPLWCADCKSYHPIGLHTDTPSAAPTPDEHKCGYICNHCKQHFPGYAQYWGHKCKTPAPPTEGSAEEWVQAKMITREDIDGDLFKCLQEDDALKLARRADLEADNARQSREEIEALKADVVAAQAEAVMYKRVGEVANKVSFDLMNERDAAQAEARELRKALEEISALYDNPSPVRAFNMHTVARAALAKKEGER